MNTLIGFVKINTSQGEIPLKFGAGAIRLFLAFHDVKLNRIMTDLFETQEIEVDGQTQKIPTAKDLFGFAGSVLWCGAEYYSRRHGGNGYEMDDAIDWIDDLGGINSPQITEIYKIFFKSIANGGPVPKEPEFETPKATKAAEPKKKKSLSTS